MQEKEQKKEDFFSSFFCIFFALFQILKVGEMCVNLCAVKARMSQK